MKISGKTWKLTPTSVNTYLNCARGFYYRYKLKLKTKPSIHLVRGNIVHKTLELFFKFKLFDRATESYSVLDLFYEIWHDHTKELNELDLSQDELNFYYDDSRKMIINFLQSFAKEDPKDLNPITEIKLESDAHQAYAIADIIKNGTGVPHIIDYKTSKSMEMIDDYRLQLAIQALCYHEKSGVLNFKVGIHFLKFPDGLKMFTPTIAAINEAAKKILYVRERIKSNDINDYPCTCPGWCKRNYVFDKCNEHGKNSTTPSESQTSLSTTS